MAQKRSDSSFKNKVDEEGKNSGKQNASFETNALNYNEEVFQLLMGVNKWTMYFMEKLGIKKKILEQITVCVCLIFSKSNSFVQAAFHCSLTHPPILEK